MYFVYVSINVCVIAVVVYVKVSIHMCIFHHREFSIPFLEFLRGISVAHCCIHGKVLIKNHLKITSSI